LASAKKEIRIRIKDVAESFPDAVPVSLMTVSEVFAYLQVHPSRIYRMLRHNQIPAFPAGSGWRFNMKTVDSWCFEQEKLGG